MRADDVVTDGQSTLAAIPLLLADGKHTRAEAGPIHAPTLALPAARALLDPVSTPGAELHAATRTM